MSLCKTSLSYQLRERAALWGSSSSNSLLLGFAFTLFALLGRLSSNSHHDFLQNRDKAKCLLASRGCCKAEQSTMKG